MDNLLRVMEHGTASAGLISTAVFNILAWLKFEGLLYTLHLSARSTGEIILPELLATAGFMLVFLVVLTCATVKLLINSISGPLFRIKKDLGRMAQGDLSFRIILRTRDRFKDVANDMNSMADSLQERWKWVSEDFKAVSAALLELAKYQREKDKAGHKAASLLKAAENMKKNLAAFRVKA